jgi:hypothetical protein
MDSTKLPAPKSVASGVATPGLARAGAGAPSAGAPSAATSAEQGAKGPPTLAAPADRVDIAPLDSTAALQILIAEVRASFDSQALLAAGGLATPGADPDNPQQAARALMEIILQAEPEEAGNAQWGPALASIEMMLHRGLDGGISAVSLWRDVPAAVVETVNEARALVLALLDEGPQNPIWLRPEWAGLVPKFERFWRRRRRARRRLTDPDSNAPRGFDGDEPEP